jgi:type VI secretion system protein ImpH
MATARRGTSPRLIDVLADEPERFDFYLEMYWWRELADPSSNRRAPVGEDAVPQMEVVRFKVNPSLSFPKSAVSRLTGMNEVWNEPRAAAPPRLEVGFFGLTGPVGVLPEHYTTLILQRAQEKDTALRDFLDLFHHRLLSFFYRSKAKYSIALSYERSRAKPDQRSAADAYTNCLYSVIGMGTAGLRGRLGIDDEALLRHCGALSRRQRPAAGLASLLSDFFGVDMEIQQFHGAWLYLHDQDLSRLPSGANSSVRLQLGRNMVIGRRVYDRASHFRVRIGPLNFDRFREFLPIGKYHRTLNELIRFYTGKELAYDVQLMLKANQAPAMKLSSDESSGPRLGWTSWVASRPHQADLGDVVFSLDDAPAGV